jgi:hypothetical protein
MTTRITLALALLVAVAAAAARAGQPAATPTLGDPRAAFAETDRNHDGVVDHEEFQERLVEVFYFADADKNGVLDAGELQRLPFGDDFRRDDKDADGTVTLHEFLRVRFKDYDAADANHDGVLELDEVVTTYERKVKQ